MQNYKTEQEKFWAGEFGKEYIDRNNNQTLIAGNINLFSNILSKTDNVTSVIEFGSNIGLNLIAINELLPGLDDISAVEINHEATLELKKHSFIKNVYEQSIFDFQLDFQRDFVFTKGVLIHLNPDFLDDTYNILYNASRKYICIVEYYNPSPVEITYRGHQNKLFKRDFAGEMLDKFTDLKLIDYGFKYRRDNNFPQDDLNWFLLEKK